MGSILLLLYLFYSFKVFIFLFCIKELMLIVDFNYLY